MYQHLLSRTLQEHPERKNTLASETDSERPASPGAAPEVLRDAALVNPWIRAILLVVAVGLMTPTAEFVSLLRPRARVAVS